MVFPIQFNDESALIMSLYNGPCLICTTLFSCPYARFLNMFIFLFQYYTTPIIGVGVHELLQVNSRQNSLTRPKNKAHRSFFRILLEFWPKYYKGGGGTVPLPPVSYAYGIESTLLLFKRFFFCWVSRPLHVHCMIEPLCNDMFLKDICSVWLEY